MLTITSAKLVTVRRRFFFFVRFEELGAHYALATGTRLGSLDWIARSISQSIKSATR